MKKVLLLPWLFLALTATAQTPTNLVIESPLLSTPGRSNIKIGVMSSLGRKLESNVLIGDRLGFASDSLQYNVIIGPSAGSTMFRVNSSVILGNMAGNGNKGSNVILIGQNTGGKNKADGNILIGSEAGLTYEGTESVVIGYRAATNNRVMTVKGRGVTYIGYEVAIEDSLSSSATYLGFRSGFNFRTGFGNTFLGAGTGTGFNETYARGSQNTFVGTNAGQGLRRTENNVFVGFKAGAGIADGRNNVLVGTQAGSTGLASPVAELVLIGHNAQATGTLTNAIALGANTTVTASNALILGNDLVNVGIGTTAPQARLEVVARTLNSSGLRLTSLAGQAQTDGAPARFLTVDGSGDVVLGTPRQPQLDDLTTRLLRLEKENQVLQTRLLALEQRRCFLCFRKKPKANEGNGY